MIWSGSHLDRSGGGRRGPLGALGITRRDEVGEVARAMDGMIAALAAAQLERDRQEEARRRLVAAVGHDLRTPLTARAPPLEAVRDGLGSGPRTGTSRRWWGTSRCSDRLIDDLFLASRLEAGSIELALEEVDLGELVEAAAEALAPVAAERSVGVSVGIAGPVPVRADPVALGGRCAICWTMRSAMHPPTTKWMSTSRRMAARRWSGSDTGVRDLQGLPVRAFNPFIRPDPSRPVADGGAVSGGDSQGIVSAHLGTIWIEDGPGGLVAFCIPADHTRPTDHGFVPSSYPDQAAAWCRRWSPAVSGAIRADGEPGDMI